MTHGPILHYWLDSTCRKRVTQADPDPDNLGVFDSEEELDAAWAGCPGVDPGIDFDAELLALETERARRVLQVLTRPDIPCAREAAHDLFQMQIPGILDDVWATFQNEILDCPSNSIDCCDNADKTGWSFEFARKGHFDDDDGWIELRGGSEGLSSVPNIVPFSGFLKVVTAASSRGQTPNSAEWEWRVLVNQMMVAAHPVTGIAGRTEWLIPVNAGDIVDADGRVTGSPDVNDMLVRLYFEKG